MKAIIKKFAAMTMLALTSLTVWAQSFTVSGVVIDATGEPVIGANVVQQGTQNGSMTDLDGKFSFDADQGSTIEVSFIGYISQTIKAGTNLTIVLQEDLQQLDEMIVVGYGVQKKSDVTGSIASVKAEAFENRTVTSLENALQGKAAGVQLFSESAAPGASGSIQIRGFSSNGSSNPLYVVDGLRTSSIANLDPNSIESMEVLKDAASAAIYGAEAGNGVILITTKKGKQKNGTITYDFQYTWETLSHKPEMMNAAEYIEYYTDGWDWADKIAANYDGKTDTNWADEAYETGRLMRHNLTFSNSTDNSNVYLGLSMLNNNGIVVGDNDTFKRFNVTLNADYKVTDWLKVGANTNLNRTAGNNGTAGHFGQNYSIFNDMMGLDPLTPVYMTESQLTSLSNYSAGQVYLGPGDGTYYGISRMTDLVIINPLIHADAYHKKTRNYNVNGTFYANLTPIKNLTITSRWGYDYSNAYSREWTKIYYANASANNVENGPTQSNSSRFYYQIENFANYLFEIDDHHFNLMAGQSYAKTENNMVKASAQFVTQDADNFYYLDYGATDAYRTVGGTDGVTSVKISYYGRVSYDWKQRYMLQASLRADAADLSQLSVDKRWGYFPAVSAGWEVTRENWFPRTDALTYLKLRASWGQNGSLSNLGNYSWSTAIISGSHYPYGTALEYANSSYPNALGNKDLKWETSEQLDFGIDLRMFRDRLTFGMDYFEKKTKDLIVSGITPSLSAGASASPINSGNVENKGFEFELSWKDHIGDFNYSISGNLATLDNEVTYLDPTLNRITTDGFGNSYQTCFEVGYPVWFLRGYKYEGINRETGDPIFKDVNGNGVFDDGDKDMIGSGIPTLTAGATINLEYKGIDLVVFGTGAFGHDLMYTLTTQDAGTNRLHDFYAKRWTKSNTDSPWPRANCTNETEFRQSSGMVYSGDYFKIKQIQIGYSLPKKLIAKARMSRVRAYLSLDDFFTFTSYPGTDPEVCGSTGVDLGAFPTSKKVVFGLNVAF